MKALVRPIAVCRACGTPPQIARTRGYFHFSGRMRYGEWFATCPNDKCWAWTHVWGKSRAEVVRKWNVIHKPNAGKQKAHYEN